MNKYTVQETDSGQLMIANLGDVVCLSDSNVEISQVLYDQFTVMCNALNAAWSHEIEGNN